MLPIKVFFFNLTTVIIANNTFERKKSIMRQSEATEKLTLISVLLLSLPVTLKKSFTTTNESFCFQFNDDDYRVKNILRQSEATKQN